LASGESVALSARYADQKGSAVNETINWSVSDGGTLDATTGSNVNFSAATDGVYIVTASTATFPDLKDQLQIFVGDWMATGVRKPALAKQLKGAMTFSHMPQAITIFAPFAGKLQIVGLNGRVVKSIPVSKAGMFQWKTGTIGNGLYIVQLKGTEQHLRSKLLVRK